MRCEPEGRRRDRERKPGRVRRCCGRHDENSKQACRDREVLSTAADLGDLSGSMYGVAAKMEHGFLNRYRPLPDLVKRACANRSARRPGPASAGPGRPPCGDVFQPPLTVTFTTFE